MADQMRESLAQEGLHVTKEAVTEAMEQAGTNRAKVFEALLDRSFAEVGSGCLPRGGFEGSVPQTVVLQINKVRDVNLAKRKLLVDRSTASNPTRMLRLALSDGKGSVVAVEVARISAVSAATPPGTKVKIMAGAPVRNGMIALDDDRWIRLAGGKVDAMLQTWQLEQKGIKATRGGAVGGPPPFVPLEVGKKGSKARAKAKAAEPQKPPAIKPPPGFENFAQGQGQGQPKEQRQQRGPKEQQQQQRGPKEQQQRGGKEQQQQQRGPKEQQQQQRGPKEQQQQQRGPKEQQQQQRGPKQQQQQQRGAKEQQQRGPKEQQQRGPKEQQQQRGPKEQQQRGPKEQQQQRGAKEQQQRGPKEQQQQRGPKEQQQRGPKEQRQPQQQQQQQQSKDQRQPQQQHQQRQPKEHQPKEQRPPKEPRQPQVPIEQQLLWSESRPSSRDPAPSSIPGRGTPAGQSTRGRGRGRGGRGRGGGPGPSQYHLNLQAQFARSQE